MNMKRPTNIQGQIRYFGIGLAEMSAQVHEKGGAFSYEIDVKENEPTIYVVFGRLKERRSYNVRLGSSNVVLNQFEANIEAEMEVFND